MGFKIFTGGACWSEPKWLCQPWPGLMGRAVPDWFDTSPTRPPIRSASSPFCTAIAVAAFHPPQSRRHRWRPCTGFIKALSSCLTVSLVLHLASSWRHTSPFVHPCLYPPQLMNSRCIPFFYSRVCLHCLRVCIRLLSLPQPFPAQWPAFRQTLRNPSDINQEGVLEKQLTSGLDDAKSLRFGA